MSTTIDPNDYQLNDEQKNIRIFIVAMLVISSIFVALRCFVRTRLQAQFSTDDWLLLVALAGFVATTVMIVLCINEGGFGRKTAELAVQTFYTGAKFLVLSQVIYTLTMMVLKLSIALLQLRIVSQSSETMRKITLATIAANVIMGTYEFFALLLQCTPPKKYWTPSMTTGHCVDRDSVATGVYVYSAVNVVLDWYYALALAPMVWKLQMKTVTKVSTIFVLGVGIFASVANLIRFKSLIGYAQQKDVLYIFIPIATWTFAEMCLAFAAASIATFRPLVRYLSWMLPCNVSQDSSENESPHITWKTWRHSNRRRNHIELSDMEATIATVQSHENVRRTESVKPILESSNKTTPSVN